MNKWAAVVLLACSSVLALGGRESRAAVTSNDLIADAIPITSSPATFQIDTTSYNSAPFATDPVVECGGYYNDEPYPQTRTAWFTFTPETAGAFTAETANTVVDTVMVLWEYRAAEPDPFVEIDCNDDNLLVPPPRPGTSRIPGATGDPSPLLKPGTTYYLEVMSQLDNPGGAMDVLVTYSGVIAPYPVPVITSLSPGGVATGSGATSLAIGGSGFTSASKVTAGAMELTPATVTESSLTVTLPATLLANPADLAVAVTNPAPGGGTSNSLPFVVFSAPSVVSAGPLFPVAGSGDLSLALVGTSFRSGMTTATVDGFSRTLTIESATSATLELLAADLLAPGVLSIVVTNVITGGPTLQGAPYQLIVRDRLDLDCSGSVTAEDALFLLRLLAGIGQPAPGCPLPSGVAESELRSVLAIRRQIAGGS